MLPAAVDFIVIAGIFYSVFSAAQTLLLGCTDKDFWTTDCWK